MRDLDDLATSIGRTVGALQVAQKAGVSKAALYTTRMIRTEITRVTGDNRLSGVGKRGARVGAEYELRGSAQNPTAYIQAKGPLHLVERDTDPHPIYPRGLTYSTTRRGNIRRRGRTKALKFGGRFATYADHPGTTGQHPFEHGWRKAAPKAPKIFQAEVRKAVVNAWGLK